MIAASLRRIDPERNMHRYYRLEVQRDLFGTWCLVSEWGRIGHGGRLRALPCPTENDAKEAFAKKLHRKLRRGYQSPGFAIGGNVACSYNVNQVMILRMEA